MSSVDTITGIPITSRLLNKYFQNLVNQFFKILPMREDNEKSLVIYLQSLQIELLGCGELIPCIQEDPSYLTLLSILQYLIDTPDCPISDVKREVFKAISKCNKLEAIYTNTEVS